LRGSLKGRLRQLFRRLKEEYVLHNPKTGHLTRVLIGKGALSGISIKINREYSSLDPA
jgi:hypothetical protein